LWKNILSALNRGERKLSNRKVHVKELRPGMVAAGDICCSRSGVLLLKKGTVLHPAVIHYLQNMEPEAVVHIEEDLNDTGARAALPPEKDDAGNAFFFDKKKQLEGSIGQLQTIPSEVADEEAKEIYIQAYKTINEIYKNRKIKPYLKELYEVLDCLVEKLSVNPEMMLQVALLKKIENYCLSHSINVCVFAAYLGKLLGMDMAALKELSLAGIMHDIGKLDISPEILSKRGPLTEQELESIKQHSLHSFMRLSSVENVGRDILNGVLQHHERSDGSGYPHGLPESEIHLWGRILGIVDVFDAVTSEKSYRNAVSQHEGLEILLSQSFQFDQKLLSLFIKNISFYPIGSRVLLNSGETGIVIGIHRHLPFRPIVTIPNKDKGKERVVDLSEELTLFIEKIILD
jgi:HD-GYP domain-containing protein (c-di-GMP phosphodiesterase class II)